jgi:hypothetical protein
VITKIKKGKLKGQFKVKLFADNGRLLCREIYTQKQNAFKMVEEYLPGFEIRHEDGSLYIKKREEKKLPDDIQETV